MKIKNIDTFYTPPELAQRLLGYVDVLDVENVADFCVGKGELLKAAEAKFNNIKCFGTDIDEYIIEEIKESHQHWNVEICDFTNSQSRANTSVLQEEFYDLILSNPPFTCRGGKINKIEYLDTTFHASTAMMFLIQSLRYLSSKGNLYAIMPSSVIFSEKDKKLICAIRRNYNIQILEELERQVFKNCAPNIVLLKICRNNIFENKVLDICSAEPIYNLPIIFDANNLNIKLFRGNLSVHEIANFKSKKGKPYVHSTNLRNNSIVYSNLLMDKPSSEITGPAILFHRVGKPSIAKVCKLPQGECVVLSDCVIAIIGRSQSSINEIYNSIINQESKFLSLYKGTGAKYITIERLRNAFNLLAADNLDL